ncbi:DUF2207 domain-containing protein [Yaniella halotolerans]|uniref:DUF2207 domain-containing protein n=1 Tax=Yaniella halotolerans TaxID=225453 RepID=UPI0003B30B71|nr:DUF2207 domain-containing protein [Yaniella halotolerans]
MGSEVRARRLWALIAGIAIMMLGAVSSAAADESDEDVENFQFASWNLNYELRLDDQGRAQAEVTEELVAEFPQTDQNRGIVRSLPLRYQSAPAEPQEISVTDGDGNAVPFETEEAEGFKTILVGDDSFVHGTQTYVINYTVDDVMHATDQADEFYWDIVPVDRQQPIADVTADITLDPTLSAALTGASACYLGTPGDTRDCAIEPSGDANAAFTVAEEDLRSGNGVTVAIGVEPGTVTQPPERQANFVLDGVPLVLVGASLLLSAGGTAAVWAMVRRYRETSSQTTTTYGIPADMNPLLAKWLTGQANEPMVAMILHLAVNGVLRIEEVDDPTDKKADSQPQLRLIDSQLATDPLETQLLEGLFPDLEPGDLFDFPKDSKDFTQAAQQVEKASGEAVLERGYQRTVRHGKAAASGWLALVLLIPTVVLLIMGASRDNTVTTVLGVVLGLLSLMFIFICVVRHRVLTPQGAAMRQQLEELRQMMDTSEAARLKMMQSYTHATRTPASTRDEPGGHIIALYDQFLPYAVLFGKQEDWSEVLASAYRHHHFPAPVWYPALLHHGTGGIQDSLSSMLSSVSAAAATSSPSAGSTGGGVAGGGGGGGAAGGR